MGGNQSCGFWMPASTHSWRSGLEWHSVLCSCLLRVATLPPEREALGGKARPFIWPLELPSYFLAESPEDALLPSALSPAKAVTSRPLPWIAAVWRTAAVGIFCTWRPSCILSTGYRLPPLAKPCSLPSLLQPTRLKPQPISLLWDFVKSNKEQQSYLLCPPTIFSIIWPWSAWGSSSKVLQVTLPSKWHLSHCIKGNVCFCHLLACQFH